MKKLEKKPEKKGEYTYKAEKKAELLLRRELAIIAKTTPLAN